MLESIPIRGAAESKAPPSDKLPASFGDVELPQAAKDRISTIHHQRIEFSLPQARRDAAQQAVEPDKAARGSPVNLETRRDSGRRCIIEHRLAALQVNGKALDAHAW